MMAARIDAQMADLRERAILKLEREDRDRRREADERAAIGIPAGDDSPWFVVSVAFGRELAVENAVKECGGEAFVAMGKGPERRRHHRVLPARNEVLVTGYVLVRCAWSAEAMRGLCGLEHVTGMLGGWEMPLLLNAEKIRHFKIMADNGELDYRRDGIVLKAGQRVGVTVGIFEGYEGRVVTPVREGKAVAVIELDMLGRMVPATLPVAMLEKL